MSPKGQCNSGILLSVKLHFVFIWGCSLMPKCGLPTEEPQAESIFIDGAAMVNFKPPHKPITFEAYANDVILPYIKSQASKCSRVDIICE